MDAERDRTVMGELIKRLRKSSGMSQTELARRLNISYQQVQKYENGTSELTVRRLRQVAEVLDVPVDVLLRGLHYAGEGDDEVEVLALFRRIKDRGLRHAAKKVLRAFGGKSA